MLQMRANLMGDLRMYLKTNKLTQSEAAKRLGIAQSCVSDLVRGNHIYINTSGKVQFNKSYVKGFINHELC